MNMHYTPIQREMRAYRYLKKNYPMICKEAEQVIEHPHLTDWSLIKPIYRSMYDLTENPREQMHFFLAVIIQLFEPVWFTCGTKMQPGLRDVISDAMGYINPEMVNYIGAPLNAHMKNPRFYKKVTDTVQMYLDEYK